MTDAPKKKKVVRRKRVVDSTAAMMSPDATAASVPESHEMENYWGHTAPRLLAIFPVIEWRATTELPLDQMLEGNKKIKTAVDMAAEFLRIPCMAVPTSIRVLVVKPNQRAAFAFEAVDDPSVGNALPEFALKMQRGLRLIGVSPAELESLRIGWYGATSDVDRQQLRLAARLCDKLTRSCLSALAYGAASFTLDKAINASALITVEASPLIRQMAAKAATADIDESYVQDALQPYKESGISDETVMMTLLQTYTVFDQLGALG